MILSFDIGGTFIKTGIVENNGGIIYRDKIPTPKEDCKNKIPTILINKYFSLKNQFQINAIGISSAGQVNSKEGYIGFSGNLPSFSGCRVTDTIESETGIKTKLENDANCAALGEMWKGAGKNYNYISCLTLGTGVGGAVILNRKLYKGKHELAAEFGRLVIGGPVPGSEDFIFDKTGSTISLVKRYEKLTGESLSGEKLMELVKEKNSEAIYVYMEFLNHLITGIRTIAYFYDPEVIIIGGGISSQGRFFFDKINNLYQHTVLKAYQDIEIIKAQQENDAGILGAAYICFEENYYI